MVRPGGHLEKQDDKLDAQELSLGKGTCALCL